MKKSHGCLLIYVVYIFIYIAYFILVSKLLYAWLPDYKSDDLLVMSLFISLILAVPTSFLITNWKSLITNWKTVVDFIKSKTGY